MTENHSAGVEPSALSDLLLKPNTDSAEASVTKGVSRSSARNELATNWRCTLRGDQDRERPAGLVAHLQVGADRLDLELTLWNQNQVSAASHAGGGSDPASVATHYLDNDDSVMRLGGGVEAINCVGRDLHCSVKPEGSICARQIVVNRLRHTDYRQPAGSELGGHTESVLATNRDQSTNAISVKPGLDGGDSIGAASKRICARRQQHRAATWQNPSDVAAAKAYVVAIKYSGPTASITDYLMAVGKYDTHNSANHCIEARAVAAAGEDCDLHACAFCIELSVS